MEGQKRQRTYKYLECQRPGNPLLRKLDTSFFLWHKVIMFLTYYILGLATFGTNIFAREKPVDVYLAASLYDNGARHMEIMKKKEASRKDKF